MNNTTIEQNLSKKIINTFNPSYHLVQNQSQDHAGPATDSHFKLIIVSEAFKELSLIKRHRLINELFRAELNKIHALAMHTYTPEEWIQKKETAPKSPPCASHKTKT